MIREFACAHVIGAAWYDRRNHPEITSRAGKTWHTTSNRGEIASCAKHLRHETPQTPQAFPRAKCVERIERIATRQSTRGQSTFPAPASHHANGVDTLSGMNDYIYANATPTMGERLAERRQSMIDRCTKAAKRIDKRVLFGMTTALALHGLPMPVGCDLDASVLHTVCGDRSRRIRSDRKPMMRAHVWRQLDMSRITRINGFVFALDPVHVWAQLAGHVPFDQLVMLGDAIVSMLGKRTSDTVAAHHGFITLVNGLESFRGRPKCIRASGLVMPNVDSPKETEGRLSLLSYGIPTPVTNHVVPNATFASGAVMTLDMAWPEYRVAVEYDGDQHRTDKAQWRTDQEKRERLRGLDWLIVIATAATLADEPSRAEFAWRVARNLALRGAEFPFSVTANALG